MEIYSSFEKRLRNQEIARSNNENVVLKYRLNKILSDFVY